MFIARACAISKDEGLRGDRMERVRERCARSGSSYQWSYNRTLNTSTLRFTEIIIMTDVTKPFRSGHFRLKLIVPNRSIFFDEIYNVLKRYEALVNNLSSVPATYSKV